MSLEVQKCLISWNPGFPSSFTCGVRVGSRFLKNLETLINWRRGTWLSARSEKSSNVPLTRESLAKLRLKARRRGVWFRCLKHGERRLLDLTISVVKRVRSFLLVKVVSGFVSRLCEALESRIVRLVRTEGRAMAKKVSEIGEAWGYRAARSWAGDLGFMQFLVINNLGAFGK